MTTETAQDRVLHIPEVARWTGIPEKTLRRYRSDGKGPKSFKLGRYVAYLESDVAAYIEAARAAG